jgi:hypothetical protein
MSFSTSAASDVLVFSARHWASAGGLFEHGDDDDGDDGIYICGIALNSIDAGRLTALDQPRSEFTRWHIKGYRLGLKNGVPAILRAWSPDERFTINDVVELLCEIPPGGTTSKLFTGTGWRKDGPLLALPWNEMP